MNDSPVVREEDSVPAIAAHGSSLASILPDIYSNRLLYLLDNVPEMIFIKDCEGRYEYLNKAALACLGRDRNFLEGQKPTIFDLAPPETAQRIDTMDRRILSDGVGLYDVEERVVGPDGIARWYSGTRIAMRDDTGAIVGLAGISRDITQAKRQQTLRRSHAAVLEMIVKGQPLPEILTALIGEIEELLDNVRGSVLLVDHKTSCLNGCIAPSLPEGYAALLNNIPIAPNEGSCGTAAFRREAVCVSDIQQDPLWARFADKVETYGLRSCWSTPIIGNNDVLLGTFALYSDTVRMPTELEMEIIDMATNTAGIAIDRRQAEERVHYMAHHDPLTGLSNRNLFWGQFRRALHEAEREGRLVAITYIDLNDFKQINDVHGHAVGDEVLRGLASRIMQCVRASDVAVRLGGDEFAIIFSNPTHDEPGILARLETIRKMAEEPLMLQNGPITVTCSMGTAFYPSDGRTPESLLAKADAAMYEAKRTGRGFVRAADNYAEQYAI